MYFYDTCGLLNAQKKAFEEPFLISSITLKELEEIKTSAKKDEDIKYKARKLIHLLSEHRDDYEIIPFETEEELKIFPFLSDNNDSRIILTAYRYAIEHPSLEIIFLTQDLCCYNLAKIFESKINNFKSQYQAEEYKEDYTGFAIYKLSDEDLSAFYSIKANNQDKLFEFLIQHDIYLLINEYFIIKDSNDKIVDAYVYTKKGLLPVAYNSFDSMMFGKVKGKDIFQQLAIDSLKRNTITMIRGAAGTGKSYLSLSFLMERLEREEIDKIIIFCNTVATTGSAKLGFYPGTRDEKLLDSQIGNFLYSKIGREMVERLLMEEKLVILPMSDIRGYDTTGMKAGIYISEAQNLDIELMRLALQRIGDDSICILDGDSEAQVDLPIYAGCNNGMKRVSEIFRGQPCYGEVTLQNIHRSEIARLAQLL